jgi:GT2 family glycosyltransferase
MSHNRSGVSFVVPVHNGARWLDEVLSAILAQADGRPFEVLAVDDRSSDGSPVILDRYAIAGKILALQGEGRGAAAAINLGIRHARHPIICQVDQDVILRPGWLTRLADALSVPGVGAAQGYYLTPPDGSLWARVMGLDLEQRYSRIVGNRIDHVCTGNSAYRAEALHRVGLFDESLGYGYDNDMSYRLGAAGYRLVFCRDAQSVHRWREDMLSYLRQQYGLGYGRLDLVAKHRRRLRGDDVSGLGMILHAPAMLAGLAGLGAAVLLAASGGPWRPAALGGSGVLALLALDRLAAGARAALRFRDRAGLGFLPAHLLRDAAWAAALAVWSARRLGGRTPDPSDSMKPGRAFGALRR